MSDPLSPLDLPIYCSTPSELPRRARLSRSSRRRGARLSELTPDIALLASGIKDGIRELLALVPTAQRGKALSEISV